MLRGTLPTRCRALAATVICVVIPAFSADSFSADSFSADHVSADHVSADPPSPFDARNLVEVRTLAALPKDVTSALGWHKAGADGIADAQDELDSKDVAEGRAPQRRFIVGAAGSVAVLVAYQEPGRDKRFVMVGFTLRKSGWSKIDEWVLEAKPYGLYDLVNVADPKRRAELLRRKRQNFISQRLAQTRPGRRDGPLREINLSDNEIREIQAIALRVFPGAILSISGVVSGCPCEEGPQCSDQVWIVAHTGGRTRGLQLSRIGGRWSIGIVQQWWFDYEELRTNVQQQAADRSITIRRGYEQLQEMQDKFPACASGQASDAGAPRNPP